MKPFMDDDFMLSNDTAVKLYHEFAEKAPVIDYHCHIDPREIAEDIHFNNITELWLAHDHYKWRFMRACGVEEKYITGDAPDKDKFFMWAECLGKAIGNPLYHWSHLELKRYFGFEKPLNGETAGEAWDHINAILARPDMTARNIIRKSNVKLVCTTDDPVDDLRFHRAIKDDPTCDFTVLPAWRPDKAIYMEKPGFVDYIERLGEVSGVKISSYDDLLKALSVRMDFFKENGCSVSDHGFEFIIYAPAEKSEVDRIFKDRMEGKPVSEEDMLKYEFALITALAAEYRQRNWVMQLHYGVRRNNNTPMFEKTGADTGFDCINPGSPSAKLAPFLDAVESAGGLPRTILYSLNPVDNAAIGSIIGCFQDSECVAKIQQGSAWWFNDHRNGMYDQIKSLAALGNLSGFVGMLTDSRSFISYTRHEYFRRILCDYIGETVEKGEFPCDLKLLGTIVKDISYNNAVRYFGFPLDEI